MKIAYLLGIPRSGTTLLSALLNQHPRIFCPPEPWTMLALSSLGVVPAADPADSELIRKATTEYLRDANLHHDIAMRVYESLCPREDVDWLIDKTPRYHHCLDYIVSTMPDARFLWVIRNPLDVAASFKSTWSNDVVGALRDGNDHPILFDFALGFRRLVDFAARVEVHTIRYEDLVAHPGPTMDKAFAHLGLEAIELDDDISAGLEPLLGSQFGDAKIANTTSVHKDSVDRYLEILGDDDSRLLCGLLGKDLLSRLGYGDLYDRHDAGGIENAPRLPEIVERRATSLERTRRSLTTRPFGYWQRQRHLAAYYRLSFRDARSDKPRIEIRVEDGNQAAALLPPERQRIDSDQDIQLLTQRFDQLSTVISDQGRRFNSVEEQQAAITRNLALLSRQLDNFEAAFAGSATELKHDQARLEASLIDEIGRQREMLLSQSSSAESIRSDLEARMAELRMQIETVHAALLSLFRSPLLRIFGRHPK